MPADTVMPDALSPALARWRSRLTPSRLSFVAGVLLVLTLAVLLQTARALPWAGFRFQLQGETLLVQHAALAAPAVVTGLRTGDGRVLPLPAWLAVEEPDFLVTHAAYNALLAAQAPLLAEWQGGQAQLLLADGRALPVLPQARQLSDMPWIFWLQLFYGFITLIVGFGIWVFRPLARDTSLQLLTAIGFAAGILSASLYSSRELLMDPVLWRQLSVLNHGGALLFVFGMAALLWSYPRPLGRQPVVALAFVLFALCWLADTQQWFPSYAAGFYLVLMLVFFVSCLFGWRQWQHSPGDPVARMALRWLVLSFLLGSGVFAFLQVLPIVLGLATPISQAVVSGGFLIVYLGLAAGISRHRIFHLERWWLAAWSWLLGGLLVLVVDGLVVWLLHLESWAALGLAMGVAGWLYFPLRQWLVQRLIGRDEPGHRLPAGIVQQLFDPASEAALCRQWPEVVRAVFRPLVLEMQDDDTGFRLSDDGLWLLLPLLGQGGHLRLGYCERGARLFAGEDLAAAQELHGIAEHALAALRARAHGAQRERDRIKRDLHDDLGARLLSILHGEHEPQMREEARQAVRDLRQMLATLDERSVALDEAAQLIAAEARERLTREGIRCQLSLPTASAQRLSARQFANIKRIAREGVTNAIKHAGAGEFRLQLAVEAGALCMELADNGRFDEGVLDQTGRGHHIIRSRVDELAGEVDWHRNADGGCTVSVRIPLEAPSPTVADEWAGDET